MAKGNEEEVVKKLIKQTRKDLGIPENLNDKLYVLAGKKYSYSSSNTAFITQDSEGNIVELFRNVGPFVPGQLLYSPKKSTEVSSTSRLAVVSKSRLAVVSKSRLAVSKPKKSAKVKQLKPCPPGKVRNPATGRCVNEVKKSKK